MTTEAKQALELSIQHWERLLSGEDLMIGPGSCSLCRLYNTLFIHRHNDFPLKKLQDICCIGCPVFEKTGLKYCAGTPYSIVDEKCNDGVSLSELKVEIENELDFLKSLREPI